MKERFIAGNQGTNTVANGVGPTGSPYGGDAARDDRQWNPPVADEDVPPSTDEKLSEGSEGSEGEGATGGTGAANAPGGGGPSPSK